MFASCSQVTSIQASPFMQTQAVTYASCRLTFSQVSQFKLVIHIRTSCTKALMDWKPSDTSKGCLCAFRCEFTLRHIWYQRRPRGAKLAVCLELSSNHKPLCLPLWISTPVKLYYREDHCMPLDKLAGWSSKGSRGGRVGRPGGFSSLCF